ncbi:MAG: hypothetical protein ACRDQZ_20615 [Mycobacteriales bacterium]
MTSSPDHLTAAQQRLWDSYAADFDLEETEAQELLETVVVHLDTAKKSAKVVAREGLSIHINAGKTETAHPLLKVERDSRTLALKCLKELRAKYPAKSDQRQAKKSPRQAQTRPRPSGEQR